MVIEATSGKPVGCGMNVDSVMAVIGPRVVCVRGPSKSGKTAMCERLIEGLGQAGLRVAYIKRTHHVLDLPEKSSGRIWSAGPALMVIRATDRVQVTSPVGTSELSHLLDMVPRGIDIALVETHQPEPYPTILAEALLPAENEQVFGSWRLPDIDDAVTRVLPGMISLVEGGRLLDHLLA
jgi:molybdopterin-guanine dinucleotide biosynthesis protein MobB